MIYKLIPVLMLFTILLSNIYASDMNVQYYIENPGVIKDINVGSTLGNLIGNTQLRVVISNDGNYITRDFELKDNLLSSIDLNHFIKRDYTFRTDLNTLQTIVDSTNRPAEFSNALRTGKITYTTESSGAWLKMTIFYIFSNWWR